ncbi:MAG TPA: hypothetical protein EYN00_02670 [Planctomycetes bacterium]|nr:hypothetical protein [Planctomycetota bacterium]
MNDDRKLDDMDMDNVAGGGKGSDKDGIIEKQKKAAQGKPGVDLGNVVGGASKGDSFVGKDGSGGGDSKGPGKTDGKPDYKGK